MEVWRYPSFQDHIRVREAARTAIKWRETIGAIAPMVQMFETKLCIPATFSPLRWGTCNILHRCDESKLERFNTSTRTDQCCLEYSSNPPSDWNIYLARRLFYVEHISYHMISHTYESSLLISYFRMKVQVVLLSYSRLARQTIIPWKVV